MTKMVLPFIETMVTQACNLSCRGCSNYSDLIHKKIFSWKETRNQFELWLERLDIPDVGIVGGEPLLHPNLEEWILGLRELLPNSQIRFNTNGLLLYRNPDIIKLFEQIGNCVFKITVHVNNPLLEKEIQNLYDRYNWKPVTEFGIKRFRTVNGLRLQINRPNLFYMAFRNDYNNMLPHHSDPAEAFDLCYQQTCPLLHEGRIYKCSSNGLLESTLKRFNNPNWHEWQQYIQPGLSPDCSDSALKDFINTFGKPVEHCAMCPSKQHNTSKINHTTNVYRKKQRVNHRV